MSKFLDSTGLSRLVENIKNKFQPKPYLLELSVSYDNQTNEGTVSIREDDIARVFDHLYKYKDSSDYNISFKVYNSTYKHTYMCKANSIKFIDNVIFGINIDYNLHLADDNVQGVGHIRLEVDREYVKSYYNEQEIWYNSDILLTGTGGTIKPERYYIDFEQYFFQKYNVKSGLSIKEYYFDVEEDMQILYNIFKSFYNGRPTTFNIVEENISGTINNIIPIVSISEDNIINASFIINDHNINGSDTDNLYIRKIGLIIQPDGSYEIYKQDPIEDLTLTNIKDSTLFVEQYLTNKGDGTYILNDKGEYSINDVMFEIIPEDAKINILDPKDTTVIDSCTIGANSDYKKFYTIFNRALNNGAVIRFRVIYKNTNHIVIPRIERDGTLYNIECTFIYSGNPDDDEIFICKFGCEFDESRGFVYAMQKQKVALNKLSLTDYLDDTGEGTKFLADDGSYVHTSIFITFEAESGSLDAKQKEDIDEGYNRNLPIYILYSGIKMLVNSIQKLGGIYSLSCRHDNATYSIMMDLGNDNYEIGSIGE